MPRDAWTPGRQESPGSGYFRRMTWSPRCRDCVLCESKKNRSAAAGVPDTRFAWWGGGAFACAASILLTEASTGKSAGATHDSLLVALATLFAAQPVQKPGKQAQ